MAKTSLILLPGLDGSGLLFRPLISRLPPEIRPTVVTYPPDQALGYEDLLPRVMAALPNSSPFVPAHNFAQIKAICPTIQLATFPSPHMVLQTQPDAAAMAIAKFAKNIGGDNHL